MKKNMLKNGKKFLSVLLVALMMFSLVSTGAAENYVDITEDTSADSYVEAAAESSLEDGSAEENSTEEEPGSISGFLWLDSNTNGLWDEDEYGIPGLTVGLYADGEKIGAAVTETNGSYAFEGLQAGDYIVGVSAQTLDEAEYLIPMKSLQPGEDNKFDANWDTAPVVSESSVITLGNGDNLDGVDAGMRGKPAIATTAGTFKMTHTQIAQNVIVVDSYGKPMSGVKWKVGFRKIIGYDSYPYSFSGMPSGTTGADGKISFTVTKTIDFSTELNSVAMDVELFIDATGTEYASRDTIYSWGPSYYASINDSGVESGITNLNNNKESNKRGDSTESLSNYFRISNLHRFGVGGISLDGAEYKHKGVLGTAAEPYVIGAAALGSGKDINFNANFPSGTGTAPSNVSKTFVDGGTLPNYSEIFSKSPTATGKTYYFNGWYTTSGTTGGTKVTKATASQTLYARWNESVNTYFIIYDANGGIGGPIVDIKEYGKDLVLTTEEPTREGYKFKGWGTSPTSSVVSYVPGGTYSNNDKITLYAVWETKTYKVGYNANGGSGAPASQTKTHGATLPLSTTKPTRTGYNFKGWATSASTSTVSYAPGAVYAVDADITLYAVWETKTYTVSYNANGGTGAPASQTKNHGVSLTLSATRPTREGYNFKGWGTSASTSTVSYPSGGKYTANADITLYAVWEAKIYIVSYDANGGVDAPESQEKYHDESLILTGEIPTRAGYEFKGWAYEPDANSINYRPGQQYHVNADITFYAVWEATAYTITYNSNGGIGGPSHELKYHDTDITLSTIEPTRADYKFLGWSTSKTATSASYTAGGIFKENGSLTLYAVWQYNVGILRFDPNGGTGGPTEITGEVGQDVIIPGDIPERYGYTFLGWARVKDQGYVSMRPGAQFILGEGVYTLYAEWEAKSYTLYYDSNGGSGEPPYQGMTFGQPSALSTEIPVRDGQDFLGWKRSGGSKLYQPGEMCAEEPYEGSGSLTVTLYAQWDWKKYTVKYDANGGTGAPESETKSHGRELMLSEVKPVREGYDFLGWANSKTATEPGYLDGFYYDDADITLYAVWTVAEYQIAYYAMGGEGAPPMQTKYHDVDLALSTIVPTKEGYTFLHWKDIMDLSGPKTYLPGEIITLNEDMYLYAEWEEENKEVAATAENTILSGNWAEEQNGYAVFWISLGNKAISAEDLKELSFEKSNALLWSDVSTTFHTVLGEAVLTGETKEEDGKVYSEVKVPVEVRMSGVSSLTVKNGEEALATAYIVTPGNNNTVYNVLDAADVTGVIRVINTKTSMPGKGLENNFMFEMMDMNKDGGINSNDVTNIIRIINGKQAYYAD